MLTLYSFTQTLVRFEPHSAQTSEEWIHEKMTSAEKSPIEIHNQVNSFTNKISHFRTFQSYCLDSIGLTRFFIWFINPPATSTANSVLNNGIIVSLNANRGWCTTELIILYNITARMILIEPTIPINSWITTTPTNPIPALTWCDPYPLHAPQQKHYL